MLPTTALFFILTAAVAPAADYALPVVTADGSIRGTAFMLKPDVAITAAHVVKTLGTAAFVKCGETQLSGVVVKIASDFDLALVKLEQPCFKVRLSRLADDSPDAGTKVLAVGYPGGMAKIVTGGVVSMIDFFGIDGELRYVMLADMRIFGGNSGGPVIGAGGKVVGLVTGRVCLQSRSPGFPHECYATITPSVSIRLFLDRKSDD
jgi:S1-C subfamily serine protease